MNDLVAKDLKALLAQIQWLVENSNGVAGLSLDGSIMEWPRVIDLYLPHVKHQDKWAHA